MKTIYFLFIILFPSLLYAQEGNNLVFGRNAGLNFNTEPPSFFKTANSPWLISTAYSDKQGSLKFYVNQNKFYNNMDEIIEGNDSFICGASLSVRSTSFLIPDQEDSNNIVLFSVWRKIQRASTYPFSTLNMKDSGLYINIINTKANNGKGKLVKQNKLIYKGFFDQLTIVRHSNHRDYWIICKSDTNTFVAFLYDEAGIHAPIFSSIPKKYTQISQNCRMKANNRGDLLVLTNYYWEDIPNINQTKFYNYFHLYNFNQSTGKITFANKIDEFFQTTTSLFGNVPDSMPYLAAECSFSPNDSVLYINSAFKNNRGFSYLLFQYQIFNIDIPSTRRIINPVNFYYAQLDMMQLAPNGKIYVGSFSDSYLACIENPNIIGDACYFNMKNMTLPYLTNSVSISNVLYEYKKVSFIAQRENCKSIRFKKDCDSSFVFFSWYFGDGDSSSGPDVVHNYKSKGKFVVKIKATTLYNYSVWFSKEIIITDIPQPNFASNNTVGCQYIAVKFNDLTITDTISQAVSYSWDFGDGTKQNLSFTASNYKSGVGSINHVYNQSGKYTVKLTFYNGFCENTVEKTNIIDILPAPKPGITSSIKSGCSPASIRFTDTLSYNIKSKDYDFGNGIWISLSPNHPLDTIINYTTGGDYFIRQRLSGTTGCVTEDTLMIKLLSGVDYNFKPIIYLATYINDSILEVNWNPVDHATKYQLELNSKKIELNSQYTKFQFKDKYPSRPNVFQLSALDTCGNKTSISEVTSNIYLDAELVGNEYVLIKWTPYEYWKSGVARYDLERKIENAGVWEIISSSNSLFQFNDELNNFDKITSSEICYRVIAYENGNIQNDSKSNIVCTYLKPTLFVPNAFSPNNDGLNDYFKPLGIGIEFYELYIYDRWGGLVTEIKSNNEGWDGRFSNGSLAPDGIYLYKLQCVNRVNPQMRKIYNQNGSVFLNR